MLPCSARLHPVLPRQLERGLNRLGAAAQRIDQIEVSRRQPRELGGQFFHRVMGEHAAVQVGNLSRLPSERVSDFSDTVAHIYHVCPARAIQVLPPLVIVQIAAFSPDDAGIIPTELPVKDRGGGVSRAHG